MVIVNFAKLNGMSLNGALLQRLQLSVAVGDSFILSILKDLFTA